MKVTPRVVAPPQVLGGWNGFEVLLLGVEVWPRDVVVRLAFAWNEHIEKLDAEYTRAMKEWFPLMTSGGMDREELDKRRPASPMDATHDVKVRLSDDVGTEYTFFAGSGSSWEGNRGLRWGWNEELTPSPPSTATRLDVRIAFPNGEVSVVTADLKGL